MNPSFKFIKTMPRGLKHLSKKEVETPSEEPVKVGESIAPVRKMPLQFKKK